MASTNRRGFIGSLAAAFALPLMGMTRLGRAAPRLMVTHCRHEEEVIDLVDEGIRKGVREMGEAAAAIGGSVEYRYVSFGGSPIFGQPDPPPTPITAVRDAIQIVIPGMMGGELMKHTIDSSRSAGAIVFNANYRGHDVYRVCHRHVFHVRPGPDTIGAVKASFLPAQAGSVEMWSPALTLYGADTLNGQFRGRYARRMDSAIWAGWFAVKCAWEGALASNAATADALIAHLAKPGTTFDGNKGVPLYFDANHELVQPLYLADGGVVKGEAAPMPARPGSSSACR